MTGSMKFVVTGGGGYIGFYVGLTLWKRGHYVTLFDISQPDPIWLATSLASTSERESLLRNNILENSVSYMKFVQGSVLDLKALCHTFSGAVCVIHCASYGMSGKEQMASEWDKTELVNVTGTELVLKACLAEGVRGLVYTSTFNVVFGGQQILNGDESLPYFPLHRHVDHYSRTKAIAERLVLFTDGLSVEAKTRERVPLRTSALRLAGVFGLNERRHLPRIVETFPLVTFKYGHGQSLQQFATLKNVIQAHVKAAEYILMTPEKLGGQAYFISDGVPMNTFEFLRPLREALGYPQPTWTIPMWVLWLFVYAIQLLCRLCFWLNPSFRFKPLLTPAEVYKTGVTHTFSNDKAKRDFTYEPENPNDISDVIQSYRRRMTGYSNR